MGHVHNALDRATDLIRGYRRALGIVGPDGGVERFGETLTPVIDLWDNPRWIALMGDNPQFGTLTVAANAGNRSMVQLMPSPTSKTIVIVHEIRCSAAFNIRTHNTQTTELGAVTTQRGTRDPRAGSDNRVSLNGTNTAGAVVGNLRFHVPITPFIFQQPIILNSTGVFAASIVLDPNADNTAIIASLVWTLHDVFPGEEAGA